MKHRRGAATRSRTAASLAGWLGLLICPGLAIGLGTLASSCATTNGGSSELRDGAVLPAVFRFSTDEKFVALTIDDGPDAVNTPRILDVLRRHDVAATFFVIGGRVEGNGALLARMRDEGHELGNHTMKDFPSILLSKKDFDAALRQTHELLAPYGEVRWFRPGSGAYNGAMLETAAGLGYRTALGDVVPTDFLIPGTALHAGHVRKKVRPGSIIVFHDGPKRGSRAAAALEICLPELKARGYEFLTLSELAERSGG